MGQLVLGNMDDDQTDLEARNVLLKLHATVDGQEDVEFFLRERQ